MFGHSDKYESFTDIVSRTASKPVDPKWRRGKTAKYAPSQESKNIHMFTRGVAVRGNCQGSAVRGPLSVVGCQGQFASVDY